MPQALKSPGRGIAEPCSGTGIALKIQDVLCIYFSVWLHLLTADNPWLRAASAHATYFCSSVPPCQVLKSDNWLRLVPALVAHTGISTWTGSVPLWRLRGAFSSPPPAAVASVKDVGCDFAFDFLQEAVLTTLFSPQVHVGERECLLVRPESGWPRAPSLGCTPLRGG